MRGLAKDEGFCFGLACLYETRGELDKAMEQFRAGNRVGRQRSGYAVAEDLASIEKTAADFGENFFRSENSAAVAEGDPVPIFILGMPRTGFSLIEQVLGSHSSIEPCGERDWLHETFREVLVAKSQERGSVPSAEDYDPEFFSKIRQCYLEKAALRQGPTYFTDKMPANIYKLWLAAKAFPEARFICTRRDKLATVLSCFTTAFSSGYGFSEALEDCCAMFEATQAIADHWYGLLPGRIMMLDYGRLIDDPRATIDEVFEFIGTAAEEACYRPHELERAVGTSSSMQVTRPIYAAADQRWQAYVDHLGDDKALFS